MKEEGEGEHKHIIALKTTRKNASKRHVEEVDSKIERSDLEAMNLMVKRFSKFMKSKNKLNSDFVGKIRSNR